jgi:nucleoside-diphosphate-sugar epimerase
MCDAYRRQYGSDFRCAMPTNLYGPGDNFDPENSHVVPALIRRFHLARTRGEPVVTVWGSGRPRREFLHVDDAARACVFLMSLPRERWEEQVAFPHVNVGCGEDVSIAEFAEMIGRVTGFTGRIEFDTSRPDGTPRKLLDIGLIRSLGWQPRIPLEDGLRDTYGWFRENHDVLRGVALHEQR